MKKLWVVWRWTWRIVLVFLAIFAIFIIEENIRGRIMLARYKEELRAKGEKLTLAELDLPRLQPNKNDVAIILGAGADLIPYDNLRPNAAALPAAIAPILARVESLPSTITPLIPISYDAYPRIRNLEQSRAIMRVLAWLSVAAKDEVQRGNRTGAVERISQLMSFSKRLACSKDRTSSHDQIRLLGRSLDVSWKVLHTDGWTDAELSLFQQTWSDPFLLDDVLLAAEVERAQQLRDIDRRQSSLAAWWRFVCINVSDREDDEEESFPLRLLGDALGIVDGIWYLTKVNVEEMHLLERWQTRLENARHAVRTRAACDLPHQPMPFAGLGDELNLGSDGNIDLVVAMMMETRREMTVAAIALKRYQLRHGNRPPSLTALVPEFLPDLPHDFMDGQSLRYRPIDDSNFLLYSVGKNCKDDGGDPKPSQERRPEEGIFFQNPWSKMWQGRDAVWPRAATAEEIETWNSRWSQRMQQSSRSER